jgi:hypothetical protein
LDREIPKAIADFFAASDIQVLVTRVEYSGLHYQAWVAVPTELARAALDRQAAA